MTATFPVVESFHSLQGEGAHTGRSAFFIRLAKCKVGCSWCDTKNSWSEKQHSTESIDMLARDAANARYKGAAFVVLTGGEPLHHDLNPLTATIREVTSTKGKEAMPIHLETSGVDHLSGCPDWITLSPKPHFLPRKELLRKCDELKVVINEQSDLNFAEEMAKEVIDSQRINCEQTCLELTTTKLFFLQPGWENELGHKLAIQHVKNNPLWRLSLQTHKLLDVL